MRSQITYLAYGLVDILGYGCVNPRPALRAFHATFPTSNKIFDIILDTLACRVMPAPVHMT